MLAKRSMLGISAVTAIAVLLGVTVPWVGAADEVAATPAQVAAMKAAGAAKAKKPEPKRFKDFKEVTEDMQEIEGLFPLYRYDPKDKNRDPEVLLAKIPSSLLDQDLLFATSIYSGGQLTGFMWDDYLVRWQVAGDYLKLTTPAVQYVQKPGDPVTDVVERTYTPQFIAAVRILSMTPGGDVLIDMGDLLKSDIADVSMLGGAVRSNLSTWGDVKNFPDNMLIQANLALAGRGPGSSVGVAYAFRRLPKLGSYTPREADPRVGYFVTARVDWTKPPTDRTTFERYVQRWDLEKRDPSLELSPPKEPILFIIEDTVPIRWRRWVREGIEEWNKAFEKVGFDQAIVVRQQTENNEYADYDPEDARYNFFRWITSGRAFAMGPSRVDPRTGQILDADIIFDDAFVRAYMEDFDVFAPAGDVALRGDAILNWIDENPELAPDTLKRAVQESADDPQQEFWSMVEQRLHERGQCTCGYARGMQQQLAFGHLALMATGVGDKKLPERYIGEAIKHIVTHEVGHTLGLRHNFKASAWLSLDEIRERRANTDEPYVASVMDYSPILFFADDEIEKVRHFVSPTIGPYDEWVIEYGYAIPKGKKEDEMLAEIASRCTEPALRYATDEDTNWVYSPDPLVDRFDMSNTLTDWARSRIDITDKLMGDIETWALKDDEPFYHLTRAFNVVTSERIRAFWFATRIVGGQYFNRYHKGDPNAAPAFVIVDPADRRAALQMLGDTVFSDSFYDMEPNLLNKLAPPRWYHWGARPSARIDYAIHDRIARFQVMTLLDIMAPMVMNRIYDETLKAEGDDRFTTAELIQTTRDIVWSELDNVGDGPYTDVNPYLSTITRSLQREYLNIMLSLAGSRPGASVMPDVHAMVRYALRELSGKIGGVVERNQLDFGSKAHLAECKSRIDRTLDAQFEAR